MARKATAFLIAVCLLYAAKAMAITGNEWKRLSQTQQQAYVMGVFDAWDMLGTTAALAKQQQQPSSVVTSYAELVKCVRKGMTYSQINAIVQKYMEDNPSGWHYGMADRVFVALAEACETTSK